MSTVYIISDNGKLNRSNETLDFTAQDGTIRTMFPHKMDCLIITGVVSITGAALRLLMKFQINCIFIGFNGKFNGKLIFTNTKNVLLRKKQYMVSDNEVQALTIAKAIVLAKIKNELTFVQRIKRKKNIENQCTTAILSLKTTIDKLGNVQNLAELRGYEGVAAKNYFSMFRYNLIPDWAEFFNRSKNPPHSNVNAVLSFLYTLLMYRVETAIETAGLDPMVGFLHECEYGKNALVFDLVEEWRTPIADTLCCTLFNLGTLLPDNFEELNDEAQGEETEKTVLLTKEGLRKVIPAFEKKMETVLYYPALNTNISFSHLIIEQVNHIKRVLLGEENEYKGFLYK
jgi:CRISPR-associated protein Cas1